MYIKSRNNLNRIEEETGGEMVKLLMAHHFLQGKSQTYLAEHGSPLQSTHNLFSRLIFAKSHPTCPVSSEADPLPLKLFHVKAHPENNNV